MFRSWLEQYGLGAFGAVMLVAIFVLALLSFLNNRRERENSDRLLVNEAAKVAAEKKKNADIAAKAEEAERLHRADLAMLEKRVADALRALQITARQATALQRPTVERFDMLGRGQEKQPVSLSWTAPVQNGQLTAMRPTTPRELSAAPVVRPTRSSQVLANLRDDAAEVVPGATDDTQATAAGEFVYQPTATYEQVGHHETPPEVSDPANAAWFNGPTEIAENGAPHAQEKEDVAMPAPLVADRSSVPEGPEPEPTPGPDYEGTLGAAEGEEPLTEPVPTHEPDTAPLDTEAVSAVPSTADTVTEPVIIGGAASTGGIISVVGAIDNGNLDQTLSKIRKSSLVLPTETGMQPVNPETPPTTSE